MLVFLLLDRLLCYPLIRFVYSKVTISSPEIEEGGGINQALAAHAQGLVLGSSRAKAHFDPRILASETGLSFFNAGAYGQGTEYSYAIARLMCGVYKPQVFLVSVDPADILVSPVTRQGRLNVFKPYIEGYPWLTHIVFSDFNLVSDWRHFLVRTIKTTHLNGCLTLALRQGFGERPQGHAGFYPLKKVWVHDPYYFRSPLSESFDMQAVGGLIRLICLAQQQHIKLFVCSPPQFRFYEMNQLMPDEIRGYQGIVQILHLYGVPVIGLNFGSLAQFRDPNYYNDNLHLNTDGAKLLSQIVGIALHVCLTMPKDEVEGLIPPHDSADDVLPQDQLLALGQGSF